MRYAPFVLALLLVSVGCSPNLAPLYQDYAVPSALQAPESDALRTRIEAGLETAGWSLDAAPSPNVVATELRTLSNWGLYRVRANVEVVPLGDENVRVLVHPYRVYFTGAKSKIPFMRSNLRRSLLPDIEEAFADQGLQVQGNAIERDREDVGR